MAANPGFRALLAGAISAAGVVVLGITVLGALQLSGLTATSTTYPSEVAAESSAICRSLLSQRERPSPLSHDAPYEERAIRVSESAKLLEIVARQLRHQIEDGEIDTSPAAERRLVAYHGVSAFGTAYAEIVRTGTPERYLPESFGGDRPELGRAINARGNQLLGCDLL